MSDVVKCQPPSGGCELKPDGGLVIVNDAGQPPSGGCELKQTMPCPGITPNPPAAFGRL